MREEAMASRDRVRTPSDCMMNGTEMLATMERIPKSAI